MLQPTDPVRTRCKALEAVFVISLDHGPTEGTAVGPGSCCIDHKVSSFYALRVFCSDSTKMKLWSRLDISNTLRVSVSPITPRWDHQSCRKTSSGLPMILYYGSDDIEDLGDLKKGLTLLLN
ncbi:hypothetical protein HJG60_012247 [Phyllostomus discolor]|uniref:Uncharacterized protein n=1 Tax=Phyllostomus discolor TaxID=89673 RepID=A0A834DUS4_9CHIR|nr:hypothetical protein HJG60_012247 [Phyllostomus discolor]